MKNPHLIGKDQVLQELKTDALEGLSDNEVRARLLSNGPNELIDKGKKSVFAMLFDQVKEVMVIILIVAAIVSIFLHEYIDASAILIIVILNTILGFWQEFKAEKAMAALKKLAISKVHVRRGGGEKEISAEELVPGDIVIIEAGNIIPADARLIEAVNLRVQEATLTGESEPVEKISEILSGTDVPLADRKNMVYTGTVVTYGRAEAVVTGTGMNTELGNIATMLQDVEDEQAPLQKRLARLGTILTGFALILIAVVALVTYLRGAHLKEMFMTAISMAVAAIPEGLPAVVTIALALSAQKMLKKKALIRHLPAVETLGSVTVICSDKTGTLTQNRMEVTDVVLPDRGYAMDEVINGKTADTSIGLLLLAGALCNDAGLADKDDREDFSIIGDPTEGSLVIAAQKAGISKTSIERVLPRAAEFPFDSDRKRMTTLHKIANLSENMVKEVLELAAQEGSTEYIAFTKGSIDGLMEVCTHVMVNGKITDLTADNKDKILDENKVMAQNGIRVLGTAYKFIKPAELDQTERWEQQLIYIGMTGMIDPVRPEAVEAVHLCKKAGIRVVMITGDHPLTAWAIARELGIAENGKFLTGKDLSSMSVEDLKKRINDVSVFARVSPEHKMIIIDALQEMNQIVSMTGDGVNDAPALKSADIGVAMGITGTDVSKEASDMVLLDDNFATIVAAVKEGRTIFDNIRKFVKYILAGNAGEIMVMLTGPILGMPIPLLPIQILWINLVTDGVPAIALGYEEAERNVMERPPFRPEEGIFSKGIGRQILTMGFFVGLICIVIGFWFWKIDPESGAWQTMTFTTLTFCQMAFVLCIRKNLQSIFTTNLLSNKVMLLAVGITLTLQLILIYVSFFNTVFRTEPLSAVQLGVCFLAAASVILATEIEKLIIRRKTLFGTECSDGRL